VEPWSYPSLETLPDLLLNLKVKKSSMNLFNVWYHLCGQPGKFSQYRPRVQIGSGAHPASYPKGTAGLFLPRVRRSGREADHSSSSSTEVKNVWSYTYIPQQVFMTWCFT
jgi:hypothetical protein